MSHIVNAKSKRKAKKQQRQQQPMVAAVAETTTTEESVTNEESVVDEVANFDKTELERIKEIGELMSGAKTDDDIKAAFDLIRELPSFEEKPTKEEEPKTKSSKETRDKKIDEAARKLAEKKYREAISYDYEESMKLLQCIKKDKEKMCSLVLMIACDPEDPICKDDSGNQLMMKDSEGNEEFFGVREEFFLSGKELEEVLICEVIPHIDDYYLGNTDEHILAIKVLGENSSVSLYADCLACVLNEKFFRYAEEGKPFDKIPTNDIIEEFDFSKDENGDLYYMTK
jgi:hypothetical protein